MILERLIDIKGKGSMKGFFEPSTSCWVSKFGISWCVLFKFCRILHISALTLPHKFCSLIIFMFICVRIFFLDSKIQWIDLATFGIARWIHWCVCWCHMPLSWKPMSLF
jgi:hypothetical protein